MCVCVCELFVYKVSILNRDFFQQNGMCLCVNRDLFILDVLIFKIIQENLKKNPADYINTLLSCFKGIGKRMRGINLATTNQKVLCLPKDTHTTHRVSFQYMYMWLYT